MKKVLLIVLFGFSISLIFGSCDKDSEDVSVETLEPDVTDNYYVKYKYSICHTDNHTGYNCKIFYTYNDLSIKTKQYEEHNLMNGKRGFKDEIICGPFKENDIVQLDVRNYGGYGYFSINLTIEVSKNNEPFAEKCFSSGEQLVYKIVKD